MTALIRKLKHVTSATLCLTVALALTSSIVVAQQQDSVDARLQGFDTYMDQMMKDWNAPGIGIGIVMGDKLVFAKGYGFRDYGKKLPYTPTTTQPIASNSKLFTAVAVGLLVEEGKLRWDDPIKQFVPSIRFYNDDLDRSVTIRDMLSHRTGVTRHDSIWYKSTFTRRELWDRLRYLEPTAPLRTKFLYNNLMFTAAGQVIEELSGQTWEQFVQKRIFAPLNMSRSTLTIEDNIKGPEPAVPFSERRDSTELYRQPYYTAEVAIAPAGAINSNVQDLSRWVIALLNKGKVDGKQVIPEAVLRETMAPSLSLPNSALESRGWGENLNSYYGMGRTISSYRGHLLAVHGGDLPGFHSQISIMPNDNIGVIVLVIGDHVAPMYNGLTYNIYERLLGLSLTPWSERLNQVRLKNKAAATKARAGADVGRVPGTKPSHPIDDYVGEFVHPAYGVVTVARGDKELTFDFHGIKMPLSHFHYDRFDTPDDEEDGKFSLNFRTNPMGEIEGVEISMDEAAVTFTRRVPADLSTDTTLQTYAGTYISPSGGKTVLTFQPGKGLAIRGGPDLQPWRPHQFRVKEFPDVVISFQVEGGKVLAMKQRDPSGEFVFQRSP
ncbi:MAG TPA: serine hydrolase [Pyrinomonadaceae bacterium]|jgi:CubicO group peptidase (beta-lactamase class C family)|nr:serine hydrolase [Pyrinomonadaceae bacterium]